MIISRVFPLMTKSIVVKLINPTQISTFSHSFVKTKTFVVLQQSRFRKMSSTKNAEANDPSRQFDYNEFKKKMENKNVLVIDVREHSEIQETGQIPGSIHIPLGELSNALESMPANEFKNKYNASKPQNDDEIIFSCRSGSRSLKALDMALKLGFINAGHYKGGWLDWSEREKN